MIWTINEQIVAIAERIFVDLADADPNQYSGDLINTNLWKNFTLNRNFPPELVVCSPANIIKCFQDDLFLEGLILTINWGIMSGTVETIYQQDIETIHGCIKRCKKDIQDHNSINNSWSWLTTELGWTNVMASKVLHFLCRSLNFTKVPVPIDNAQILNRFLRILRKFLNINKERLNINKREINNLLNWGQNQNRSYICYLRYMNFILA